MFVQRNVPERFRRPENLEMKPTYPSHMAAVNNYRNRYAWQQVKPIPVKRNAVRKAYNNVRKVSAEFEVPCVKKTFGEEIVRVCCRTIGQLDNIAVILKVLMKFDYIFEIGMPLEYSYKMKSLVLFIKPKDDSLSNSITRVFEKCVFGYPCFIVQAEDPCVVAEKRLNELIKEVSQIAKAEKVRAEMEKVQTCTSNLPKAMNNSVQEAEKPAYERRELLNPLLLFLKIGIIFLSLHLILHHGQEE